MLMAMFAAKRGWKAAGLGATVSLCLLVLQLALAIGSPAKRDYGATFSKSDSAVSICAQVDKDANRGPSPQGHPHKNCVACAFGQLASSQDDMALVAKSGAPFFRGCSHIGQSREHGRCEPFRRGLREQLVIAGASDFLLTHMAAGGVARISF